MKRVLIIGPFSPPITGVSFANDTLFDGLKGTGIKVDSINYSYPTLKENIGKFSIRKVLYYFKLYFYVYKIPLHKTVYMTPGQSFFGVLKYFPFILISKLFKKEIIIHVHGNHLWKEYENLQGNKKKIFHYILSKFDKGIVLSPKLRKNLTPFIMGGDIYEVYNFVENNILKNTSLDLIKKKNIETLNIVFLSNLMKEKGIIDFLNSLLILKKNKISFKAKVAGAIDSVSKEEINRLLNQLEENVEYIGIVSGDDKLNLLIDSNIFVFPTYYSMEGQPISILEAMATGNIILTTDHAGISDIFVNKVNGFYIKNNNPKDIALKIENLSKSLESYKDIMLNNYLEANKKYTTEKFINKIIEIIEK
ncbi:MAG: glycosyltransferase family 4 protein [Bacteroidota bacterium]